MIEYNIKDHLDKINNTEVETKAPYEFTLVDHAEVNSGEYLKTEDSFLRVVESIIDYNNLNTRSRTNTEAFRRFYLMYLLRTKTDLKLKDIGKLFNKDHSTVLHGISKHKEETGNKYYEESIKPIKDFLSLINLNTDNHE